MFSIKEYEQCVENIHTVVDVINNTVRVYGNAMTNGERAVVTEARNFLLEVAEGILLYRPELYTEDKPALKYLEEMVEIVEGIFSDVLERTQK